MNRNFFKKAVAIMLAVIMIGSVFAVALQAFAMSPIGLAIPNTGDNSMRNTMIIVAVVALVVVVALVIVPTIMKKRKK